jgi:ArsR family transcriptional regulator
VKLTGNHKTRYEEKARLMKALAHPTRLFIVDELAKGISTVSKHLGLLKTAGVISDDKRGLQVFYRLQTPCVLNVFECVRQVQDAVKPAKKACNAG